MNRVLLPLAGSAFLLAACASTRPAGIGSVTDPIVVSAAGESAPPVPTVATSSPWTAPAIGGLEAERLEVGPVAFAPAPAIGIGRLYTTLSLGGFEPDGDLNSFDTGFWGDLAFGRRFLAFLSFEGSVGYFETRGPATTKVYGIPLVFDARVGLPLLIFEVYGGAGLGASWVRSSGGGFRSDDDFVAMWDGFAGLELGLAGFHIGAEYKYVQLDKADGFGGTFGVEGSVVSLTGTIPW